MDSFAVNGAEDDLLMRLGLSAQGDIIALRAHCMTVPKSDKNTLKNTILQSGRLSKRTASKIKQRTIHLGWLHFDD